MVFFSPVLLAAHDSILARLHERDARIVARIHAAKASGENGAQKLSSRQSSWSKYVDKTGKTYYYNSVTKQSVWNKPHEHEGRAKVATGAAVAGKGMASVTAVAGKGAEKKVRRPSMSAKQAPATSTIAAKQAEQDMEAALLLPWIQKVTHDPKVKASIAEVHREWVTAGHKNPPSTPAEAHAYQALMTKIVGQPDISFHK